MDQLAVLDLRYGAKRTSELSDMCSTPSSAMGPLDLRTSKNNGQERTAMANFDACVSIHFSVKCDPSKK